MNNPLTVEPSDLDWTFHNTDIYAKPIQPLIGDFRLFEKLKITTYDGEEGLYSEAVICTNELGSVYWQLGIPELFKQYDVMNIVKGNWLHCRNKHNVSFYYHFPSSNIRVRVKTGFEIDVNKEDVLVYYPIDSNMVYNRGNAYDFKNLYRIV
jgi:hypothetical protein